MWIKRRAIHRIGAIMRILHVAESAQGGVGTYLAEILPFQRRELGEDGVMALVPDRHAAHLSGTDRRVIRTWQRRGRTILSLFRLALAIRAAVRAFRPTVIHAHSSFAGALVRLMYGWRPRPFAILYCPHGWGFDRRTASAAARVFARVERGLATWCDGIVVISAHERRVGAAAGITDDRMMLVLNGISDRPPMTPARWEEPRLKLLFVGRLDEQKGFDTLLDAVEPFADRIAVRAIGGAVAGGRAGPNRRGRRQVDYLGWRSLAEVAGEFAAADVAVIPSRWEGFGLVALEAMRAGCAVVASDVGGLPEIVVDGETGRLFPPDMPERLGAILTATPRAQWRAMGRAGRQRFLQHFTADRMNRQLIELYRRIAPATVLVAPARGPLIHA